MKRLLFRLGVLLLTFGVGITATYLFHKAYIQFKWTAMGSKVMEPDGYGGFSGYESYDGVRLGFSQLRFPSHEAAAEAFHRNLRDAVRVIEREPLYDRKRENIVGERVVAIFPPNEYVQSEWASVLCLDDSQLYQISSSSLRHALAFDKAHRRY
jgi:hypothetical protein